MVTKRGGKAAPKLGDGSYVDKNIKELVATAYDK